MSPCTVDVAMQVGRAAVRLAEASGGGRVLVARDTRPSGAMFEAAVSAGIMAAGGTCQLVGVLPTAGLSVALAEGLGDAGVMITASHNPAADNGFKVMGEGGHKLSDEAAREFEGWMSQTPASGICPGTAASVRRQALLAYGKALKDAVGPWDALAGKRIAIDLANGAMVAMVGWLRQMVPADWVFLGSGDGVINDGCGSEHPEALAAAVREHGCVAGLAVDGDGDRCRIIDEHGQVVPGDALAWLLAKGLGVGAMAVTVMSNGGLEQSLPDVVVVRTAVGDRYLLEAMVEEDIPLGCEESGHVLFGDALPTGDGLVTGLRALQIALGQGSVGEAISGFSALPRETSKVKVRNRPPLDSLPELQRVRSNALETLGEGGRVFLRYSGTEPVLRILVEGSRRDRVSRSRKDVERVVHELIGAG